MPATINLARIREDQAYKAELRLRAQTDLFWLAHELLHYDKISETYHREVTRHYVQKDPRIPVEEQDTLKNRLHLDPRGTFKSTINMADTVQWIICFPESAGLLLSGSLKLTNGFAAEVTGHFTLPKNASGGAFMELFPEFRITPSEVRVGCYRAPHRQTNRKEDTLMSSSIEASLSGWHFDWLKEDDIVDNRNSETASGIEKVKKNRHINRKMLMPWGYRDTAGTRYDPFDAYGEDIDKARPGKIKILNRPALKIVKGSAYYEKYGARLSADAFPEPDDCVLTFPELLSYDYLREAYDEDYSSFMTQYMNDAHGGKEIIFDPEHLAAAWNEETTDPVQGPALICWRFGSINDPAMKYSGAAVGRQSNGRMFIIDAVRGIFNPSTQARRVVELAKKHDARQVMIVDSPGARHVEHHIHNVALELGWKLLLRWQLFDQDAGARDLRLKSIEPLIADGRLRFSEGIGPQMDLTRQFSNFGMVEENELVEVIARVCDSLPKSIKHPDAPDDDDEAEELERARDMHDRVYGLGRHAAAANPAPTFEEMEAAELETYALPTNPYGLEDIMPGLSG
jgi:hypothetical protein